MKTIMLDNNLFHSNNELDTKIKTLVGNSYMDDLIEQYSTEKYKTSPYIINRYNFFDIGTILSSTCEIENFQWLPVHNIYCRYVLYLESLEKAFPRQLLHFDQELLDLLKIIESHELDVHEVFYILDSFCKVKSIEPAFDLVKIEDYQFNESTSYSGNQLLFYNESKRPKVDHKILKLKSIVKQGLFLVLSLEQFKHYQELGQEKWLEEFHRVYIVGIWEQATSKLDNLFHYHFDMKPSELFSNSKRLELDGVTRVKYLLERDDESTINFKEICWTMGEHKINGELHIQSLQELKKGRSRDIDGSLLNSNPLNLHTILDKFLTIHFSQVWAVLSEFKMLTASSVRKSNTLGALNGVDSSLSQKPDIHAIGKGLINRRSIPLENSRINQGWYFNFSLTDTCQFKCQFCNCWKSKPDGELSDGDWEIVLQKCLPYIRGSRLNFAGGEPLLRKGIYSLLKKCTEESIVTSMATNGGVLNKERAVSLAQSGLHILGFSVDGFQGNHDRLRGVDGSFNNIFNVINWIREVNPVIEISLLTILLKDNLCEIKSLVNMVKDHAGIDHIHFQALSVLEESQHDWWETHPLWPDRNEACDILDFLIAHQRDERKRGVHPITISNPILQLESMKEYFLNPKKPKNIQCTIDKSGFAISPRGELRLCPFHPPVGNLMKQGVEEILDRESFTYKKAIQKIRSCENLSCHSRTNCTFEAEGIADKYRTTK